MSRRFLNTYTFYLWQRPYEPDRIQDFISYVDAMSPLGALLDLMVYQQWTSLHTVQLVDDTLHTLHVWTNVRLERGSFTWDEYSVKEVK